MEDKQDLSEQLDGLSVELRPALERIGVPVYIIDRERVIRWVNPAGRTLVGDVLGRDFTTVVAPEHRVRAEQMFVKKLLGAERTDFDVMLLDRRGRRLAAEISSVPLEDHGQVVGVFGVVTQARQTEQIPLPRDVELTSRQHEILMLLADGASTAQIAAQLRISEDTVRNHVRDLMRRLRVHSRLEAVAYARRYGLL